jgi:phosphate transport system protein
MQRHFVQELEALKERLIRMGSLAEQAIVESIRSFQERDAVLARQVLEADEAINLLEVEIDNNVVDILALQQPVASDLRFILAAQKINNDLERIGDHAVNIAESTLQYAKRDPIEHPVDIPQMAVIAKTMLREAIDAFVHSDAKLARDVLITDDEIDDLNRKMADEMADLISADPKSEKNGHRRSSQIRPGSFPQHPFLAIFRLLPVASRSGMRYLAQI